MKLTTLLEYQRCYALLRAAELDHKHLNGPDYLAVIYAEAAYNRELAAIVAPQEVDVTFERCEAVV